MHQEQLSAEFVIEFAANYSRSVMNNDLVLLRVKALGFAPNRNNFMHKRVCLERAHKTPFGETIPAFKSFEKKLVNAQHDMEDNGSRENKVIGFVERAELQDDGVYLDLVVWKRALSDSWLQQIREGRVFVSMECEYDQPVIISNGKEYPQDKAVRPNVNVVRSMADTAMVAFVGIAVLFDGVQPGDASSGVISRENAELFREVSLAPLGADNLVSTIDIGDPMNETELNEMREALEVTKAQLAELAAAKEAVDKSLEELRVAKEQADAASDALKSELDAKRAELESLSNKLDSNYNEYQTVLAEVQILREKTFKANVECVFDVASLDEETSGWLMNMLRSYCGTSGECEPFEEFAAKCKAIAACIKTKENSAVVPTPEPEPAKEEAVAEPPVVPDPTNVEGPSLGGKSNSDKPFDYRLL